MVPFKEEIKDEIGHIIMISSWLKKFKTLSLKVNCDVYLIPHSTRQRERNNLLVSAGGFPLVMVLTEPSFILVKLEWSVELGFDQ